MKRRVEEEGTLLERCIGGDVWTIIFPMLSIVDMLIMCLVSKEMRQFFKSCLSSVGKSILYAEVRCRGCGNLSWFHFCKRGINTRSLGGPCKMDGDVFSRSGNIYTHESLPLSGLSLIDIEDSVESGGVSVMITLREATSPNWGSGHTIGCNRFLLRIPFDINQKNTMSYRYEDKLYQANRFLHAMIC